MPGPLSFPVVGSPDFLIKSGAGTSTSDILLGYKGKYGDLFTFETGPISQCWAHGDEAASELLQAAEASGRPSIRESSFGDFLFLVREREEALRIRKTQKAWIKDRVSSDAAAAAIEEHFVPVILECFGTEGAAAGSTKTINEWPAEAMERATLDAMLGLLLGSAGEGALLTTEESDALFAATSAYRKRTQKVQSSAMRRTRALKAQVRDENCY